jgi:hypothetical protein
MLGRVEIGDAGMTLVISGEAVSSALALAGCGQETDLRIPLAVRLTRTGRAIRLVHSNGTLATGGERDDAALLRLIGRAHTWWKVLSEGELTPTALAAREGVTPTWVIRVVRLAFLSPRVVEGMLAGRLRAGIDADALLKAGTISLDWEVQERELLAG